MNLRLAIAASHAREGRVFAGYRIARHSPRDASTAEQVWSQRHGNLVVREEL